MQPFNESNFDGLVDRWYQAAEKHEASTSFKMKLFEETDLAASFIMRLVKEGSKEQAKELANIILQTFDSHGVGENEGLTSWIGGNTLKWGNDVNGAYKSFHHLFEALKAVENLSDRDHNWALAAPDYTDSAAMDLLERSDASIQGHKHGDQTIPDDILNLIVHNSLRDNPAENAITLQQVSKKMPQQVANLYRGPLTDLKITTADQAIAYAKKFGKELQYLDISGIDFSESNKLEELIQYLPKLNTFLAKNSKLNEEAAEAIAASKFMKGLKALNLASNQIGDAGAKAIAASKCMQGLKALNLASNQIGDAGAEAIAASKCMQGLKELNLRHNQIGDAGAEAIAASEFMQGLKELNLRHNQIGDAGAEAIAASEFMQGLKELNLVGNQIGDAGAEAIAASEYLRNTLVILR